VPRHRGHEGIGRETALELARRGATVAIVARDGARDPGWLRVAVRLLSPFLLDARKGAATTVQVATAPGLAGVTGRYLARSREARSSPASHDREAQRRLWEASERLTGLAAAWSHQPGGGSA
jgi:NAD(P)-dependent dehydrogenase (short-subunit alcohol dehydrogenase family)